MGHARPRDEGEPVEQAVTLHHSPPSSGGCIQPLRSQHSTMARATAATCTASTSKAAPAGPSRPNRISMAACWTTAQTPRTSTVLSYTHVYAWRPYHLVRRLTSPVLLNPCNTRRTH